MPDERRHSESLGSFLSHRAATLGEAPALIWGRERIGFAGARYVDLADPKFAGTLQVDFLWSIARHAR